MSDMLFPLPDAREPRVETTPAPPRVQRPDRRQVELRPLDLEALLPDDHRARVVWAFVEGLDLTPFYAAIKAVEGQAGRPPIDPAILMALWLYATLEGVGSARAVARLCEEHHAYRWRGGAAGGGGGGADAGGAGRGAGARERGRGLVSARGAVAAVSDGGGGPGRGAPGPSRGRSRGPVAPAGGGATPGRGGAAAAGDGGVGATAGAGSAAAE